MSNAPTQIVPIEGEKSTEEADKIISFIRRRDYSLIRELGRGACGLTVLLHDPVISENFVCKKFSPKNKAQSGVLFPNFLREIKILSRLTHTNLVRVFNWYVYPEVPVGYILMEYIDGLDIDKALKQSPETANEIFSQTIAGFVHLEKSGVLHRDIRAGNIMVCNDGIVKIIDFGFGKEIVTPKDFDKSINLNLWCEAPQEYIEGRYDFATEVYFVGQLFDKYLKLAGISDFKHFQLLDRMRDVAPGNRIQSFVEVQRDLEQSTSTGMTFSNAETSVYRTFADSLFKSIRKISKTSTYYTDTIRIMNFLSELHRNSMLEYLIPEASGVAKCFIETGSFYPNNHKFSVNDLAKFLALMNHSTEEKRRVIIANLHSKLNSIERFDVKPPIHDDDIPF